MKNTERAPFVPADSSEGAIPPGLGKVFGTRSFFRLWLAQVVASTGDWMGIVAILAVANRISGGNEAAASLVLTARVLPGFFLAPVAGVLVDRLDRRQTLVVCNLGRAGALVLVPFVTTVWELFVISFVLELFTLVWSPAKEASVPDLVPVERLGQANSLNMLAAYGTFPIAAALFIGLTFAARILGDLSFVPDLAEQKEEMERQMQSIALWFNSATFVASALIILRVPIPHARPQGTGRIDWMAALRDLKQGVVFIAKHALVRGVMIGLGAGILGGAAVIPLGTFFAEDVLHSGSDGYGVLLFAMGLGAAAGAVIFPIAHRKVSSEVFFSGTVIGSGVALVVFASMTTVRTASIFVFLFGAGVLSAYTAGFTVIQEHVASELRGRTFAALYSVIRLCMLLSLALTPLASGLFDQLSANLFDEQSVRIFTTDVALPGARLTLWFGGIVMMAAGVLATFEVRRAERAVRDFGDDPSSVSDDVSVDRQ